MPYDTVLVWRVLWEELYDELAAGESAVAAGAEAEGLTAAEAQWCRAGVLVVLGELMERVSAAIAVERWATGR